MYADSLALARLQPVELHRGRRVMDDNGVVVKPGAPLRLLPCLCLCLCLSRGRMGKKDHLGLWEPEGPRRLLVLPRDKAPAPSSELSLSVRSAHQTDACS